MSGNQLFSLSREVFEMIVEELIMETNRENRSNSDSVINPLSYGLVHPRFRESVDRAFWEVTVFWLSMRSGNPSDDLLFRSRRWIHVPDRLYPRVRTVRIHLSELNIQLSAMEANPPGQSGYHCILRRLTGLREISAEFAWYDRQLTPENRIEPFARLLASQLPQLRFFGFEFEVTHPSVQGPLVFESDRPSLDRVTEAFRRAIRERNIRESEQAEDEKDEAEQGRREGDIVN